MASRHHSFRSSSILHPRIVPGIRAITGLVLLAAALSWAAPAARAADNNPWELTLTPYIFVPGIDSKLAVKDIPVEVGSDDSSFDLLDHLDFAFMIKGQVRYNKWSVLFDYIYLKLGQEGSVGSQSRDFESHFTFQEGQLALGYRVVDQKKFVMDAFAGARVLDADVGIKLDSTATRPARKASGGETWIDPIVGLQAQYRIDDHWALNGYADVGGFGVSSDLTYQFIFEVSYAFNETVSVQLGYRYFSVDFSKDNFTFDVAFSGPVVGLTLKF